MSATTKTPYAEIHPIAARLLDALRPYCHRIEIAGSLRRKRDMIGDIEIVAIPRRPRNLLGEELPNAPTALDQFLTEREVEFMRNGPRYKQFTYGRHTVDLFLAAEETWGSVYTIRTGSADFSRWLVSPELYGGACPFGITFQDGRVRNMGRDLITPEESAVFAALGLAYIPPPERTGPPSNPVRVTPVWRYDE